MGILSAATALNGCDSKSSGDDDDDDDNGGDSGSGAKGGTTGKGGTSAKGGTGTGGTTSIPPGSLGSPCDDASACDDGLTCYSNVCIPDSSGTGGTTGVEQGTLGGPCYPNDTCNTDLVCTAGFCLPDPGTSTGGTGTGGNSQGGSGGTTGGTGSSVGGTGGTTGGTGGSTGGSGGTVSTGGTGGSTGGTGGSTGGTGGSTGGTGGTSGNTGEPSTLIVAEDGWVADGSNTVGIVGPWYTFHDGYSEIYPLPGGTDFTGAGAEICVEGTVALSDEYGPSVGLNFNQPDGDADPLAYTPATYGVTGFSFGLVGSPYLPEALQITFLSSDGTQYCTIDESPSTTNYVSFSDTYSNCWTGSGTTATSSQSFEAIQFQLPVNYNRDQLDFSFCITNLKALTD